MSSSGAKHVGLPQEWIRKKRDGQVLSMEEIEAFVQGVTSGDVSEAQIAAFSMAVFFQDLNVDERVALTLAVRDSGRVLRWDRSIARTHPGQTQHWRSGRHGVAHAGTHARGMWRLYADDCGTWFGPYGWDD